MQVTKRQSNFSEVEFNIILCKHDLKMKKSRKSKGTVRELIKEVKAPLQITSWEREAVAFGSRHRAFMKSRPRWQSSVVWDTKLSKLHSQEFLEKQAEDDFSLILLYTPLTIHYWYQFHYSLLNESYWDWFPQRVLTRVILQKLEHESSIRELLSSLKIKKTKSAFLKFSKE